MVQGQPGQNVHKTPLPPHLNQYLGREAQTKGLRSKPGQKNPISKITNTSQVPGVHTCNPSYSGGRDQEDRGSKLAPNKQFMRPYLEKNPLQKRAGEVAQVIEHLLSKRRALSSTSSTDPQKIKTYQKFYKIRN
jgi:hypothetical protein